MILFFGSSALAEVLEILYANRVFCHVGAQFRDKVTKKQADCQTICLLFTVFRVRQILDNHSKALSLSLQTHEDFIYS